MTQYTVEHYERQGELISQEPASLFGRQDIYVEVDEDDAPEVSRLLELSRYGVTVRPSTKEEIRHVWDWEVEQEEGDDDICRRWPEEEGEIIMQIKDW